MSVGNREDWRRFHHSRIQIQMSQGVRMCRSDWTSDLRYPHQRGLLVGDFHTIRPRAEVAPARSGLPLPWRQALVKSYGDELMIDGKPDGDTADTVFMSHASLSGS